MSDLLFKYCANLFFIPQHSRDAFSGFSIGKKFNVYGAALFCTVMFVVYFSVLMVKGWDHNAFHYGVKCMAIYLVERYLVLLYIKDRIDGDIYNLLSLLSLFIIL